MFRANAKYANKPLAKTGISGQPIIEDVEASLKSFGDTRFKMVIVASTRVRDLQNGSLPFVKTNSKPGVTALLEIAAGKVDKTYTRLTRVDPY